MSDDRFYLETIELMKNKIQELAEAAEKSALHLRESKQLIDEKDNHIRELNLAVAERTSRIHALESEWEAVKNETAQVRKTLSEVYDSTTWRVGLFYGRCIALTRFGLLMKLTDKYFKILAAHGQTHGRILRNEGLKQYLKASYDYRKKWLSGLLRRGGPRGNAAAPLNHAGSYADISAGGRRGRVSIVLPVYNQAAYLRDAVEGVLSQTYKDIELIIVNDGSTDGIETILDSYVSNPLVRIFTQENLKLPSALNNGFAHATGEYYTWTSADNIMLPHQIEELVGFLENNGDADMVYSDYEVMDDCGEPLNDPDFRPQNQAGNIRHIMKLPGTATFENLHDSGDNFIGPSFMYRRHIAKIIGDYSDDAFGAEDYDYWLRISSLFRMKHLGKVLYRYRVHANTLTAKARDLSLYDNVSRVLERDRRRRDFYEKEFRIIGGGTVAVTCAAGSQDKVLLVFKLSRKNNREVAEHLGSSHVVSVCVVDTMMDEYTACDEVLKACDYIIAGNREAFELLSPLYRDRVFICERAAEPHIGLLIRMANSRLFTRENMLQHQRKPASLYTGQRRLKVALQVQNLDRGGMEQVVYDLATQIKSETFNLIIIVIGRNGFMGERLGSKGIDVIEVHEDLKAYEKTLRDRKVDIINTHFSYFGLEKARGMGICIIETIHNNYTWLDPAECEQLRYLSQYTDRYIAVSRQVKNHHRRRFGISPASVDVIPNGLNLEGLEGADAGKYTRHKLGFREEDFIFLNVASFSSTKAHKLMVRAMSDLVRGQRNLKLIFVGGVIDQGLYQGIRSTIDELELQDTIKVMDRLDRTELRDMYTLADCFLLPSFQEGWSIAAMEAMYFNLPLILTDVGSARDLITPESGIVIGNSYRNILAVTSHQLVELTLAEDFMNLDDLKRAMRDMFVNRNAWRERARGGRERIVEEFSVREMVERYEEAFRETYYVTKKTNHEVPATVVTAPVFRDSAEPLSRITYEHLGIDPRKFYDGKFMGGEANRDYLGDAAAKFDIDLSRIRFLVEHIRGERVLDIGCGAGHYGRTIKEHCQIIELTGIDMDQKAVDKARGTYDKTLIFTLEDKLPFPDNYFDAVFSVDFFGHVEFRSKNSLVKEISRVTRPGGLSVHVIESGDIDYLGMDVTDPEDKALKYIKTEGHVGIEPADKIGKRWERYFDIMSIENAFIYPLYPVYTYLADKNAFGPEFCALLENSSERERQIAQVCLGFVSDHMKQTARAIDPRLLMPDASAGAVAAGSRHHELVSKIFQKPCGLIYLACRKREAGAGVMERLRDDRETMLDRIGLTDRMKEIIHAYSGATEGMMDEFELSELIRALFLSDPDGSEIILELGTYKGNTASLLAEILQAAGKNNLTVCIDAFDMVVPDDFNPRGSLENWLDRNSRWQNKTVLVRSFTADAASFIAPGSVSFLLIDAFHEYEAVCQDISLYLAAVKKGGVIFLDDYNEELYPGVFRAVNELLVSSADVETVKLSYYAVFRKK